MDKSAKKMDKEEEKIEILSEEINPEDKAPDSLAEATTAPLDEEALGRHSTQADYHGGRKQ